MLPGIFPDFKFFLGSFSIPRNLFLDLASITKIFLLLIFFSMKALFSIKSLFSVSLLFVVSFL